MNQPRLPLRRMIIALLCIVSSLAFTACGGGSGGGSPGDVMKKYVTALSNADTQAALTCIAPEKRGSAQMAIQMGSGIASAFVKSEGGLDSVTILNVDVQGDKALVGYQTKTKQGMERRDSGRAEKINGTWYIAQ
jgi:hypothetical protein